MLRIVTDTASDITFNEAKEMNIQLVMLPVTFESFSYNQRKDEDFEDFYSLLKKSKELPKTSQPSPAEYLDIFTQAKEKKDDVLVIALSSGLSGTYQSAQSAKEMSEYDNIAVVDSKQGTIGQRMLVNCAIAMRDEGKGLQEIVAIIKDLRERIVIFGVIDTLTYLKKGGRIPASMALIGNTLNIKPIITLKDKKIALLGKTRGFNNGIKYLYNEFEKAENDSQWPVFFGHTNCENEGKVFMQEAAEKYKLGNTMLFPIGSVIGTHVGPGCLAIAFVIRDKKLAQQN